MNSPREILLGKYRHEESSLDAVRREALSQIDSAKREMAPAEIPWPSLTELFFRLRWHLAALAAVWAAIALLSILAANSTQSPPTQRTRRFAAQGMTVARENRRLLNELLRPGNAPESSAAMPGAALPRNELFPRTITV
jgi:hypothetical protein